ncbi:hypothetical protein GCM10008967_15740 [Bacillus carboniphilus]|uniref:Uncharacterized protein n=1 Tax=Bacillus carboniphilus TaxID=86663 RepID=A0ABN0W5T0_9BACI
MDMQTMISVFILMILLEATAVTLFILYKKGRMEQNPFIGILKKEYEILYYAFCGWGRKLKVKEGTAAFTYHKKSSYFWIFLALMHEQVIEMVIFHIYLKQIDPLAANLFTALHIYSIVWILGDYHAVRHSPVLVKQNLVQMKVGVRKSLTIRVQDIATIQPPTIRYGKSGGVIHEKGVFHVTAFPRVLTRVFGMTDEAKYEILLKYPVYAEGIFGLKKEISKIYIYLDCPEEFVDLLHEKMADYNIEETSVKECIEVDESSSFGTVCS